MIIIVDVIEGLSVRDVVNEIQLKNIIVIVIGVIVILIIVVNVNIVFIMCQIMF